MATTCRLALRHFTTSSRMYANVNIQKPKIPGTERRILDAVTVPVLPPDPHLYRNNVMIKCRPRFRLKHQS
uniref:Uncharacterized protein n=1 Tax=Arion vulgaris TaxID=1028688 RepID=A0A0B6ZQG3_9EUPU